jgi:predicted MFS family arabinose efflux permease
VLRSEGRRLLLTARRRWLAIGVLALDQLVAWGALYYAYAIVAPSIAATLDLPRLAVAACFSVSLFVAGVASRCLGARLDVHGTRAALRAGAWVGPIALAAVALAHGPWSLAGAFVLLGLAQALSLYEPAFRTLVDWCPDERARSRATLLVTSVGGFASTVFLPLTTYLVAAYDWRVAVAIVAGIVAVVLVSTRHLLPLPVRPRLGTPVPKLEPVASARWLARGFGLHALSSTGVFLALTWHFLERGETATASAAIAGAAGAAQVPGRLVAHPLRTRMGAAAFLPALLFAQAVALAVVALASGTPSIIGVIVFGAASGMMTLERAAVLVEWYGRERFGAYQGRIAAVGNAARAAAPFVVEVAHRYLAYGTIFGVLAAGLVAGGWLCVVANGERLRERGRERGA